MGRRLDFRPQLCDNPQSAIYNRETHMGDERISRLRVPDEAELPEDLQELYAQNRAKPGFVPNVFQALALRPSALRGFIALYDSLMTEDSGLSKAEREMIVVAVSAVNHCHYCLVSHGAVLRIRAKDAALADTVAANYPRGSWPCSTTR
jgi:uncharacterized peroxidase-related enzyme